MRCTNCGNTILDGDRFCDLCGAPQSIPQKPGTNPKKKWVAIGIIAAVVLALIVIVIVALNSKETGSKKDKDSNSLDFGSKRKTVWLCSENITYDENGEVRSRFLYTYDESGNKVEEMWYWEGKEYQKRTWTYDENGNLVEHAIYDEYYFEHPDYNIPPEVWSYTYDENNLLKEMTHTSYEDDEHEIYIYDANNRLIKTIYADWADLQDEYTYDDRGNMIVEHRDGGDNPYDDIYYMSYDEKNRLIEKTYYQDEEKISYTLITYDASDRIISYNYYDYSEDNFDYERTYTYDENGNVLTYVYKLRGRSEKNCYTYDQFNNLASATHYNSDGTTEAIYTYENTYDSNGNLIEQKTYCDDELTSHESFSYVALSLTEEEIERLDNP